mmetsp:Transcript_13164/g.17889  ORF Transcript_13164/g.17889 Transcript_13164/m.17889 type:complete len:89 (-) Transcript_13164:93-359(-)
MMPASTACLAAERLTQPFWAPTKRQKLAVAADPQTTADTTMKVFDLFLETRMTMREGLIRVLEQHIDSSVLKQEPVADGADSEEDDLS